MGNRKKYKIIFFALSLGGFITPLAVQAALDHPNCKDHPFLNDQMQFRIAPHLLPIHHPMRAVLDSIFSKSRVLENERTLIDAGFSIIAGPMALSFVTVARHQLVPGYVFKLYLDSETRQRKDIPHWQWLARRCDGAKGIRKIIKRENITHFVVPDKWLYVLPVYPFSSSLNPQPLILMETDMEPVSPEVTEHMWKTIITREYLDELYTIFKHGYGGQGTIFLTNNVPFTKQGKFAFTDTEDPREVLKLKHLQHIKKYLSKEMQRYWDTLISDAPTK